MFISTWKYLFLNDYFIGISTGTIPLADIMGDVLTAYQKDKACYIQYTEETLPQIKRNNFLYHYVVFILKHCSL